MVGDAGECVPVALSLAPTVAPTTGEAAPPEVSPAAKASRRCSARYKGKQRPYFGTKRPDTAPKKEIVKKRARMDLGLMQASTSDVNGVLGEVSADGEVGCHDQQNGELKSGYVLVKETLRAFNSHYLHFVQKLCMLLAI
ncbi:hypothetical protein B296_00054743 [Ensete ventricosum]|uniref:Uncharacterized protein n=1 Tax=Ensete ventricosum TaxID=4639 RepID=A0A426Y2L4_ENSVE|nr:hypothetical protein B296_00054743 [Ensete ventricosum]